MKKVLVDPHPRRMNEVFAPKDVARLEELADVIWARDEPMPLEQVAHVKRELFAVVTGRWRYGVVDDAPNLRVIMELGGGHPSPRVLEYETCFARGIRVLSCAPAFGPMVAEMALGMTLAVTRNLVGDHNFFVASEEVYGQAGNLASYTLFDKTVGFIGYGGLARNLQPLLEPFHCAIQAYDPWLPDTYLLKQGVLPTTLDQLLETSKVIYVLAVPSVSNKGLLSRDRLMRIARDSVLVLISRAHLVDFDALTELVRAGRFRAAIDVFPQEPLAQDHPIRSAPGVVLSAHHAGNVPEGKLSIGRMAVDDLETMLAGLPPTEMQVAQPEILHLRG